ncbi:MAG: FKBP-type peptidyl-prolyl cis-trans isomerase [Nitrospiraceae bacterium]|nr:FKBP-type peptidyl-prolyl cis-trans isomerase [Nitrospiraceae bacterium]
MSTVKQGDTIRIHYVGKFEDGSVFDSSEGGASLEMKLGNGDFIPGLEEGVIGMSTGEKKVISLPAEKAYGLHFAERVFEYDLSRLEGMCPQVGQQMQMYRADGQPIVVTVTGLTESRVTLDANHPLAGKDLIFEVLLEEIL